MQREILLALCLGLTALACRSNAAEDRESHADDPGAPDVVVLDSAQLRAAEISYVEVQPLAPDTLYLTGTLTFEPSRVSHVGPRMQGRIREVAVEVSSLVRAGDTLAVLDSPELASAQAAWFKATVAVDVARQNFQRVERLSRDGIVSERRRLEAEAELRQREAELAAAERALAALGAQPDSAASSVFVLQSPLNGIVVEKHATVGEVVGPDAELFTVGDLQRLWLLLDLYEADLPRVHVGTPVVIRAEAYPGREFPGRVGYVGAIVDTVSRTVKVRVEIPNPDRTLKPGMFARAALAVEGEAPTIGVPREAVQRIEGGDVVFLPDSGGRFLIRPVVLGRLRAGGWVEVLEGLSPGDTIVGPGSFALKAELQKGTFGEAQP